MNHSLPGTAPYLTAYRELSHRYSNATDRSEKIGYGANLAHVSFVLRDKELDTSERKELRAEIWEDVGHEILHIMEAGEEESMPLLTTLAELILAIDRTLKSPIDDADKLAHLQEVVIPPDRVRKARDFLAAHKEDAHG